MGGGEMGTGVGMGREEEELNIFGSLLYFKVKQQRIAMRSKERRTYKREPLSPQLPRHTASSSLSEQLALLLRENSELKQEIIELKVHQFYQFDDKKLKELITETEKLRKDVKSLKEEVKELQTVNDFLKRTNTHLKGELEKEIGRRKKEGGDRGESRGRGADRGESKTGESCLMKESRMIGSKQTDHTRNTDCSQDQFSHVSSHANFYLLQNTTLDEALKQVPAAEYSGDSGRQPRNSLMQKILSPRRGKQRGPANQSNEYLLYRRHKDRQQKE